jgi:hypothetical protein
MIRRRDDPWDEVTIYKTKTKRWDGEHGDPVPPRPEMRRYVYHFVHGTFGLPWL